MTKPVPALINTFGIGKASEAGTDGSFSWKKTDKANELKALLS